MQCLALLPLSMTYGSANETHSDVFLHKRRFAALITKIVVVLYKALFGFISDVPFKHPFPSYPAMQRH